ncbi:MAG: hypothetical protein ACPLPR_02365 [Bacillota bacterium]
MSIDLQAESTQLVQVQADSQQEMALRLADMKSKLALVKQFFSEVMVQGQDYGVIPGTDKPTLLKPGAEKLCELYGYAPVIKDVQEEKDIATGFYRARVTVALVHRRSGVTVAEGVGEANTMEGRYRWRWVPEWKLPDGIDRDALKCEERKAKDGKTYKLYKVENEDPWALWNTVLKMAKKRALIDATLSATRSSGIFTQDAEDLAEWIDGSPATLEGEHISNADMETAVEFASEAQRKKIYAMAKHVGLSDEYMKKLLASQFGVDSSKKLTKEQASKLIDWLEEQARQKQENAQPA